MRQTLKRHDQQQMTLRVYTQEVSDLEEIAPYGTPLNCVDIAITTNDGQQDIYLTEPVPYTTPFKFYAVLGEKKDEQTFIPLIYSNKTATYPPEPTQAHNEQSNPITEFIMSLTPASSAGKTASGQGKEPKR